MDGRPCRGCGCGLSAAASAALSVVLETALPDGGSFLRAARRVKLRDFGFKLKYQNSRKCD